MPVQVAAGRPAKLAVAGANPAAPQAEALTEPALPD
jgi:hypothetical protein